MFPARRCSKCTSWELATRNWSSSRRQRKSAVSAPETFEQTGLLSAQCSHAYFPGIIPVNSERAQGAYKDAVMTTRRAYTLYSSHLLTNPADTNGSASGQSSPQLPTPAAPSPGRCHRPTNHRLRPAGKQPALQGRVVPARQLRCTKRLPPPVAGVCPEAKQRPPSGNLSAVGQWPGFYGLYFSTLFTLPDFSNSFFL